MARVIDINDRNRQAVEAAKLKTMRALGAIRGVAELARGPSVLNEAQVDKIRNAMQAEVDNAHRMLQESIKSKGSAESSVNFEL